MNRTEDPLNIIRTARPKAADATLTTTVRKASDPVDLRFIGTKPPARPWDPTSLGGQPLVLDESELATLGVDPRGRTWRSHARYGEFLEAADDLDPDFLSAGIMSKRAVDGVTVYRKLSWQAPGSWARITAPAVEKAARPAPVPRPFVVWAHTQLAGRRTETVVAAPQSNAGGIIPKLTGPTPHIRPARGPILGVENILAAIARRGATVELGTDQESLIVKAPSKSASADVHELVRLARPLLIPYLRDGKPPTCVIGEHHPPVPAVAVIAIDAPACEEHAVR